MPTETSPARAAAPPIRAGAIRVGAIRVGVIGASPDRGWAGRAHIPALRALPGLQLTAVGTSRPESAARAAAEFGAAHAFTDPRELAEHPEVDLVAVTVKVPDHADLVRAALAAGKHVYCEWPLASTTEQAQALLAAATNADVHHAVGVQARYAPAVRKARELIASGLLGRITSASVYTARAKGSAAGIPAWAAYTLDRSNGAGTLEVLGGHTLDLVQYLLGEITELTAKLATQQPRHTVLETGRTIEATSPDHVLLTAATAANTLLSVHVHDGEAGQPRTNIEIAGTKGALAIQSTTDDAAQERQLQIGELRLRHATGPDQPWQDVPLDPDLPTEVPNRAANVARLYQQLAHDINTGQHQVPDFAVGLRLHHLLDAIRHSAETGTRQEVVH